MSCGGNLNLCLNDLKGRSSLLKICEAIAVPRQPDLAKGIWSKKNTKYSVFLWRLKRVEDIQPDRQTTQGVKNKVDS